MIVNSQVAKSVVVALVIVTMLGGCGTRAALRPKDGNSLPQKPFTAGETLTPDQLLTPDPQARPDRSDEQLKRSQKRRDDKFDLPPPG